MNEERFRTLIREAVGEEPMQPWLAQGVRARIAQPVRPASRAPLFALVAAVLLLAVLVAAIAPRFLHRTSPTTPGAIPTPTVGLDWSNCTLPVIAYVQTSGGNWQTLPGFVNTQTGRFSPDSTAFASVSNMPADRPNVGAPASEARVLQRPKPVAYSLAAASWLPESPNNVSPDGLSYVYIVQKQGLDANGSLPMQIPTTLMRYDVRSGKSVQLWTRTSQFYLMKWTSTGILLRDGDFRDRGWIVDAVTGTAEQIQLPANPPPSSFARPTPTPGDIASSGTLVFPLGYTAAGEVILSLKAGRQFAPETKMWVYYDTASGKQVSIYQGTLGDANGFDPGAAIVDSTGIWFSSFRASPNVWHWDMTKGLRALAIEGQIGGGTLMNALLAGPCF